MSQKSSVPQAISFVSQVLKRDTKRVVHAPSDERATTLEDRQATLIAIAKARTWINDLAEGRETSFANIAKQEGKVERHIRLLATLAFVSPRLVLDIIEGVAPPFAITGLAKRLPDCWHRQK
jgi:site-specific DNA recombinase